VGLWGFFYVFGVVGWGWVLGVFCGGVCVGGGGGGGGGVVRLEVFGFWSFLGGGWGGGVLLVRVLFGLGG